MPGHSLLDTEISTIFSSAGSKNSLITLLLGMLTDPIPFSFIISLFVSCFVRNC